MKTNTLYRFFDTDGSLLYVGITSNPPMRFSQHRSDKSWWTEVTRIEMAQFPDRASLAVAEREAIQAESPRYNKMLNGARRTSDATGSGLNEYLPFSIGNFVAVGMTNGKCPVGVILYVDEGWITLGLKSYLTGYYDQERCTYRMSDVRVVVHAQVRDGIVDDDHLAEFQTRWKSQHEEIR